jgi:hypothetical protein
MLALQGDYHDGHIDFDSKDQAAIPKSGKVVVLFMNETVQIAPPSLTDEQNTALHMQSQSAFAQNVLLNPLEDVWNHV